MEIIRLEEVKEYCDKHNVERNAWVAGAIDKVLAGTHSIHYKHKSGKWVVNVDIDLSDIHSHMQSLKGFDDALSKSIANNSVVELNKLAEKQAGLTIGELADDFEIGIA